MYFENPMEIKNTLRFKEAESSFSSVKIFYQKKSSIKIFGVLISSYELWQRYMFSTPSHSQTLC